MGVFYLAVLVLLFVGIPLAHFFLVIRPVISPLLSDYRRSGARWDRESVRRALRSCPDLVEQFPDGRESAEQSYRHER